MSRSKSLYVIFLVAFVLLGQKEITVVSHTPVRPSVTAWKELGALWNHSGRKCVANVAEFQLTLVVLI